MLRKLIQVAVVAYASNRPQRDRKPVAYDMTPDEDPAIGMFRAR